MENSILHTFSIYIANRLNKYTHKEGLEYKKVILGAEIILINTIKSVIVFTMSVLMGVFLQTIMTLIGFNFLRRFAFGLHARNNIKCAISSVIMFVLVPYIFRNFQIHNLGVLVVFIWILISLYLYAPSDTEARPIIGSKKRALLKKRTLKSWVVLLALVLIVPYNNIKMMMTLGAVYESFFILPISYKIMKRRRDNYEQYE